MVIFGRLCSVIEAQKFAQKITKIRYTPLVKPSDDNPVTRKLPDRLKKRKVIVASRRIRQQNYSIDAYRMLVYNECVLM